MVNLIIFTIGKVASLTFSKGKPIESGFGRTSAAFTKEEKRRKENNITIKTVELQRLLKNDEIRRENREPE